MRYIAEIFPRRNRFVQSAAQAYEAGSKAAEMHLPATDPLRLGLALNFSVFNYEVLNSSDEACQIAQRAFDCAIADKDDGKKGKESIVLLGILRDNLTLWTASEPQEQ